MENIPARNMNPPESNAPDCPQCGLEMNPTLQGCDNPRCEQCVLSEAEIIAELRILLDTMEALRNAARRDTTRLLLHAGAK